MFNRFFKTLAITLAGVGIVGTLTYKDIAHNIMSHNPTGMTAEEIVRSLPKLVLTRGDYDAIPDNANVPEEMDLNAIYLGKQENPLPLSKYRPTSATLPPDVKLYDPSPLIQINLDTRSLETCMISMLYRIREMKEGDIVPLPQEGNKHHSYYWDYGSRLVNMRDFGPVEGFGNFTLSIGYDEKGKYLSFYDVFDFQPGKGGYVGKNSSIDRKLAGMVLSKIGKPIYFYKRTYFSKIGLTDEVIGQTWEKRTKGEDAWFLDYLKIAPEGEFD